MSLGTKTHQLATSLIPSAQISLRQNCQNFYIELAKQLLKRFDLSSKVINECSLICPDSIKNKTSWNISSLAMQLGGFNEPDMHLLNIEWHYLLGLNLENVATLDIEEFWEHILALEGGNRFVLLRKLVQRVLIIPTSSANCERVFSEMNLIKTNVRNRLSTRTVAGLLHSKAYIKRRFGNCTSFASSMDLNRRYKDMYE